jgi:Outer membrane protein beta-barrel domain
MPRSPRWFIVPALLTLIAAPLHRADAQFVSISPGLMAGGSLSTFTGNFGDDVKNYAGFIAGAFVRVGVMGFAVQPGVYYTTKGAKSSDFSETTGAKRSLDFIQIPIVLRLHMGPLYVGGGPAVGFKLGCKLTFQASTSSSQDCGSGSDAGFNAKSLEYSGILEAGLEFGKFSLGARGDFGLSNVSEAINGGGVSAIDYKTQTVSLVAAIRF